MGINKLIKYSINLMIEYYRKKNQNFEFKLITISKINLTKNIIDFLLRKLFNPIF